MCECCNKFRVAKYNVNGVMLCENCYKFHLFLLGKSSAEDSIQHIKN